MFVILTKKNSRPRKKRRLRLSRPRVRFLWADPVVNGVDLYPKLRDIQRRQIGLVTVNLYVVIFR